MIFFMQSVVVRESTVTAVKTVSSPSVSGDCVRTVRNEVNTYPLTSAAVGATKEQGNSGRTAKKATSPLPYRGQSIKLEI
ncbi:MAG: hypothetical protein ACXIUD_06630 [Mongoliitalea sp.]